jgi:hypothetical protein
MSAPRRFGRAPGLEEQLKRHEHQPIPPPEAPPANPAAAAALQTAILHGMAKAAYGQDKRTLDPTVEINLGNQVPLQIPSDAGFLHTETTIFEARARNNASPELMTVYVSAPTNSLGAQDAEGNLNLIPIILTAHIEWGVGGARHIADMDANNGCVFTIDGTFVRVTIELDTTSLPSSGGISQSASISYGPRAAGTVRSNVFTEFTALSASGVGSSDHEFDVPPWAQRVVLYVRSDAAGTPSSYIQVDFLDAPGGNSIGQFVQAPDVVQEIPLPGLCAAVRVSNVDVVNGRLVTAIFELAL